MHEIALFYMVCVGTSIIVTTSSIFDVVRNAISSKSDFLGELVNCPMCVGFWAGIFWSLFNNNFAGEHYVGMMYPIYAGILSSLFSWTYFVIADCMQSISLKNEEMASYYLNLNDLYEVRTTVSTGFLFLNQQSEQTK